MARNNNEFLQYKNRVQGAVERDLLQDVNFQNAELFKNNIYNQQVNQGLSYNEYVNNLRRQVNDNANQILMEQQNGLTTGSALRQEIQTQQQAGSAFAGTANSFSQSQRAATNQLVQANRQQDQLRESYTLQEAQQMYEQDLAEGRATDSSRRRTTSAIFGAFGALGAVLSFIPPLAPLGLGLDVISAAGMIGTSAYEVSQNPSSGNLTQLGIDTLFAGLTLVPGISALRNASKMKAAGNISKAAETTEIAGLLGRPTAPAAQRLAAPANAEARSFIAGSEGVQALNYPTAIKDINSASNLNTAMKVTQQAGLTQKETKTIVKEVAEETGKTVADIEKGTDIGALTKYKNKAHEYLKRKSTYDRMQAAQTRRINRAESLWAKTPDTLGGNLITSGRLLSRSVTGSLIRGAGRGVAIGGTRYFSSNILNKYLPGNSNEETTTQIAWRKTFDELGIPQYLRPKGM